MNEASLDYRVVFATALDGEQWVLRRSTGGVQQDS
ncbi:hypothetical protein IWX64_002981 [Arthrobacter sp. CAN_A212]